MYVRFKTWSTMLSLLHTRRALLAAIAVTLVLVWEWDVAGLPALPAVCFGFLVPNADLLWRDFRNQWLTRREAARDNTEAK